MMGLAQMGGFGGLELLALAIAGVVVLALSVRLRNKRRRDGSGKE